MLCCNEKPDENELFFGLALYRNDFNFNDLNTELSTWYDFKAKHNLITIKEIHHYFSKNIYLKSVFPNILILLVIFLTVPVTSAECERSFSCLKRLKTWLRSTIGQSRLSSLAI